MSTSFRLHLAYWRDWWEIRGQEEGNATVFLAAFFGPWAVSLAEAAAQHYNLWSLPS